MTISRNVWDIQNVLGDLICLIAQSIFWTIVLARIETKKQKINTISVAKNELKNDEDVQIETARIEKDESSLVLKVQGFSKTYEVTKTNLCKSANKE
jgi:hypothetical protein